MRKSVPTLLLFFSIFFFAKAQNNCLTEANLLKLDAQWEQSNLNPDLKFFETILGENFIWVHNHASLIDDKAAALKRTANQIAKGSTDMRSRISSEVTASVTGKTGIVTGYTIVDRGPGPIKYHFMRTYTEVNGKCLLIANHTMAIPEDEKP